MSHQTGRRNTRALEPTIITDPVELAKAEARNGLRQYDAGIQEAQTAIERGGFKLRPSLICALHRVALDGLSSYAGIFRPGAVEIGKSKHEPPQAHLVPILVEELCNYVNDNWERCTALHLAAYVMWRLNWIHPFADGNGRTSRTVSYVVLSILPMSCFPFVLDIYQAGHRRFLIKLSRTGVRISKLLKPRTTRDTERPRYKQNGKSPGNAARTAIDGLFRERWRQTIFKALRTDETMFARFVTNAMPESSSETCAIGTQEPLHSRK